MRVLLDTNILGRMTEPRHVQHQLAVDAVAALIGRGDSPCLVPQVLYEFWVVATRPAAANGLGMSPGQAASELFRLEGLYVILPDGPAIYPEWKRLVATHSVSGKGAHDARIVAAMIVHGLTHLLTFNTPDFARFPGITALAPTGITAPPIP
jgi:predicted nucleic acid-binding protein